MPTNDRTNAAAFLKQLTTTAGFVAAGLLPWDHLCAQGLSLEWAKATLMSGGTCTPYALVLDASGHVHITGRFSGPVDFDPGPGVVLLDEGHSGFLAEYSSTGDLIYAKAFQGAGANMRSTAIVLDAIGNIYITGVLAYTWDLDPGPGTALHTSTASWDVFIAKFNASGQYIYSRKLSGTYLEYVRSIALDASGNIYITGRFGSPNMDADPGPGTTYLAHAGGYDIFLLKYNALGSLVWGRSMGGPLDDKGEALTIDANGNVIVTGSFKGTADFNPGAGTLNLTSAGGADIFFAKYDPSGNVIYAQRMGAQYEDIGQAIARDASGNVLVAGTFQGTIDLDPGAGSNNVAATTTTNISACTGGFLAKYSASGSMLYGNGMPSDFSLTPTALTVDASGNAYLVGSMSGTVDFDPSVNTAIIYSPSFVPSGFMAEFAATGALLFAKNFIAGSNGTGCETNSVAVDANGSIFITGTMGALVDLDPGPASVVLNPNGGSEGYWGKYSRCIVGTLCNDGDPNTTNDVLNNQCVCAGALPCSETIRLDLQTDASPSETFGTVTDANGSPVATCGPFTQPNTLQTVNSCVPVGCYDLCVYDTGGDGLTSGGYVWRNGAGWRLIDSEDDGGFSSSSCACSDAKFCLPMGQDRLIDAHCDKENWISGQNNVLIASANPAVSAQWGIGNQSDDGYQFWFFAPHGGYCRRILRTHSTSGGSGPANSIRATKLVLSSMVTMPLPCDILLNVRVRSVVNGVYSEFGPACRFRLLCPTNTCPITQISPVPSSGTVLPMNGISTLSATNVGAQLYQFRFTYAQYNRRITSTSNTLTLTPGMGDPLLCGTRTYNVRVRVRMNNSTSWCPYGNMHQVTISSGQPCNPMAGDGHDELAEYEGEVTSPDLVEPELLLWPNPNSDGQLRIAINDLDQDEGTARIDLFDLFGKHVLGTTRAIADGSLNTVIDIDLADGMYVVNVMAGAQRFSQRLVHTK